MDPEEELLEILSEIKDGNKNKARKLLRVYIKAHPIKEDGWWIFARIAENIDQRIFCLQKVIDINPDYKDAQYQLERAESQKTNSTQTKDIKKREEKTNIQVSSKHIIAILSIIVVVFITFIAYTNFIQPRLVNSSNPIIVLLRDLNIPNVSIFNRNSIKNQILRKFAIIDEATQDWELKLDEEMKDYISYGDLFSLTIDSGAYYINEFQELYPNEFRELATLAKPLADAYLEAEIVLGGYDPGEDNKIPYEKVFSCVKARSLIFDYAYNVYSGDISYPVPSLDKNSCTRYESYYEQFLSGLR